MANSLEEGPCYTGQDPCTYGLSGFTTDQEAAYNQMFIDRTMCMEFAATGIDGGVTFAMDGDENTTSGQILDYMSENFPLPDTIYYASPSATIGSSIARKKETIAWSLSSGTKAYDGCGIITTSIEYKGGKWLVTGSSVGVYTSMHDIDPAINPCDTGEELEDGICVNCVAVDFEVLKNTNFSALTSETDANNWDEVDIRYDKISQSDIIPTTNNIAHFGDNPCESISQPITIDNGEYRYNNTVNVLIEFSYIDIRNATPDSTFTVNVGGEFFIYDLSRIRDDLPLINDLYSFTTGGDTAKIEFPAPSVNTGEFADAELYQNGNIILEVINFSITGYEPCTPTEVYDIDATDVIVECVPPPPCIPQYLYNQDLYRRQIVTFKTDIQGLIPQYLDKIMISHSALQWGEAGQVAVRDEETLTLSENLVDITDGKTIVFRDINGDISGAYGVVIVDEYTIQVSGMPDWVTVNTFYTIQEMATAKEFLVISVKPSGDDVTIECVNYDENIYKDGEC